MQKIRVIDFTRLLPGPLATYILTHLSFEVIKVEDTQGGDLTRYSLPLSEDGQSSIFNFLNVGKKSLSIDLKTDKGREIVARLIERSDVLIEGFRPGTMSKLGVDFDSASRINPRIIYCSISGYGQVGPKASKAGHDLNYISFAGIERLFISNERALVPPVQIADISGALFAVISILYKLLEREILKEKFSASYIDISMVETSLFLAVESLSKFLATGREPEPCGEILSGGVICYNVYRTRDGKWVSIGALEPKFWKNLVDALELDLLPSDAMTKADESNPAYLKLKNKFLSMTSKEIEEVFNGKDIPYEFVSSYADMVNHPHLRFREIFYDLNHKVKLLRLPFMKKVTSLAPSLGQHTKEILKELGYSDDEIVEFKRKGIILF